MEERFTVGCPLDCPDACSLEARVSNGRLQALQASAQNPLTAGFLCAKVREFPAHQHGAERLRHPLRRTGEKGGDGFERIGWDEALELIASRLQKLRNADRAEAILPLNYGGSNGFMSQGVVDERLFRRLGASKLHRSICAAANGRAGAGLSGKMIGIPFDDYPSAELIVIWGANPSATSIHHVPWIKKAQAAGAKLVVVDPRRIPLARGADLHLAPQPGSDLPLALAIIRWLFENKHADLEFLAAHTKGWERLRERAAPWTLERAAEACRLEVEEIEAFARLYARSSPAVIRLGWGVERSRNGGSASAAIMALPAVAGKFGCKGGGLTASNGSAWSFDTEGAINSEVATTRTLNMSLLGEVLEEADPPVEFLFVYDANPVATHPDSERIRRGLRRDDLFVVVFDQVMTESARYADLVLPATTFLEHDELSRGYGALFAQSWRPPLAAEGEARSNHAVFLELLDRLELSRPDDPRTPTEVRAALTAPYAEDFPEDAAYAHREREGSVIQFETVWPNSPDRRLDLFPAALEAEAPRGLYVPSDDPGTEAAPFALISPALARLTNSSFGLRNPGIVPVRMNPLDAHELGLREGQRVRIHNALGEVVTDLRLCEDVRRGVLVLPKGLWPHNTHNGKSANSLCPATLSDLGQGACYNDTRVGVTALPS